MTTATLQYILFLPWAVFADQHADHGRDDRFAAAVVIETDDLGSGGGVGHKVRAVKLGTDACNFGMLLGIVKRSVMCASKSARTSQYHTGGNATAERYEIDKAERKGKESCTSRMLQ